MALRIRCRWPFIAWLLHSETNDPIKSRHEFHSAQISLSYLDVRSSVRPAGRSDALGVVASVDGAFVACYSTLTLMRPAPGGTAPRQTLGRWQRARRRPRAASRHTHAAAEPAIPPCFSLFDLLQTPPANIHPRVQAPAGRVYLPTRACLSSASNMRKARSSHPDSSDRLRVGVSRCFLCTRCYFFACFDISNIVVTCPLSR